MGILIYLTTTRTNISYVVGILSRFMNKLGEGHWSVAKRVVIYLNGNKVFGIEYSKVYEFKLIVYSNFVFEGDIDIGVSSYKYTMIL